MLGLKLLYLGLFLRRGKILVILHGLDSLLQRLRLTVRVCRRREGSACTAGWKHQRRDQQDRL